MRSFPWTFTKYAFKSLFKSSTIKKHLVNHCIIKNLIIF
jgi:hypothetical protein